jgi:ferredoxin
MVDAAGSLEPPPPPSVARRFTIVVEGAPTSFDCAEDTPVLIAMERCGRKAIAIGCRGGGCGFCRVQVRAGEYRTQRMSRAHVTEEEERQRYVLACRLFPLSDLRLVPARKVGPGR